MAFHRAVKYLGSVLTVCGIEFTAKEAELAELWRQNSEAILENLSSSMAHKQEY